MTSQTQQCHFGQPQQYPSYSKYTRMNVCMRLMRNNCSGHLLIPFPVLGQSTLATTDLRAKVGLLFNHFGQGQDQGQSPKQGLSQVRALLRDWADFSLLYFSLSIMSCRLGRLGEVIEDKNQPPPPKKKTRIVDQGILSLLSIGYYIHPRPLETFEIQMLIQVAYSQSKKREGMFKEQNIAN